MDDFLTTEIVPYWMNQRLRSQMDTQTPSLHRDEYHQHTDVSDPHSTALSYDDTFELFEACVMCWGTVKGLS